MGGVFIRDIAEWTVVVGLPESVLEHFSNPTVARQVFAEPSAFSYGLSFQSFVGGIPVDHVQGVFIQSVALNPSFLGLLAIDLCVQVVGMKLGELPAFEVWDEGFICKRLRAGFESLFNPFSK